MTVKVKQYCCKIYIYKKFYFNIYSNVIYSGDGNANFSAVIIPEIILKCWFGSQETFHITIDVALNIYFQVSLKNKKFKINKTFLKLKFL